MRVFSHPPGEQTDAINRVGVTFPLQPGRSEGEERKGATLGTGTNLIRGAR
jgi:hypothetical protein